MLSILYATCVSIINISLTNLSPYNPNSFTHFILNHSLSSNKLTMTTNNTITTTTTTTTPQSLSLPFRTRVQVTFLNYVTDFARRTNGTINRRLMNLLDRHIPPNPVPYNSVSSHDVIFDPKNNLYFRLFVPHSTHSVSEKLPIIVFFHGGGFAFLSAASYAYDAVCRRFCRKLNAVVCSVEYRLSPEHKFPTQFDDGFNVLKFLDNPRNREKIPEFPANADVSSVFLAGDSAGGNLAHNLAIKYASTSSSTFSLLHVIGLINIQPFFGGKERVKSEIELEGAPIVSMARTDWLWKAFLPNGLDLDHWAVNVSGPNAVDVGGMKKYPPTLVFVGGYDPLKDWQMRYYEWLRKSGKEVKLVKYESAIHAFYVFPELPETNLLFAEIKEFMSKCIFKS